MFFSRRQPTLAELLAGLDPDAPLAERHLWLVRALQWLRGDRRSPEATVARLMQLIEAVELQAALQAKLRQWWHCLLQGVDLASLLVDFGLSTHSSFISAVADRLRRRWLPGTPETQDASELFALLEPSRFDAQWLNLLSAEQVARLTALLQQPDRSWLDWQHQLLDAISYCTAQIRATGFAADLRLRMSAEDQRARTFQALPGDVEELRSLFQEGPPNAGPERLLAAVQQYRARLDACRRAINSVYAHLDQNGISVGLVFRLRQLRERFLRVRDLLDTLIAPDPALATVKLLARRAQAAPDALSVRSLVTANSTLLAAKVAERSAETGEHYITRNRADYRDMFSAALGGGAVTGLTTWLKFGVLALGLSAFWSGFAASVIYAASFVLIQLLHFTLATKQPAMTAPAMAAKLLDLGPGEAVEAFVDEVTHLVRSQVVAVLGNVLMVVPAVLLIHALISLPGGTALMDRSDALHVLASLTVLGPTLLWAVLTGVLLFSASLIAGWVENWFVLHRMDSALRYNPRITRLLGRDRAPRWAALMRRHISGFASNISLGFMLGLLPPVTAFLGLGLEVRHVTLSAGQLTAAAITLGREVWQLPAFWWSVLAIPLIGLGNLSVSFYLAFRLALQARSVSRADRLRIGRALRARLRHRPRAFVAPD